MKLLDFKMERLIIKHLDVFMSYERYMPEKAEQIKQDYLARKEELKMISKYNLSPQPVAVMPIMPATSKDFERKMRSTLNHDSSKALKSELPSIAIKNKAPNFTF